MLELYKGALEVENLQNKWYRQIKDKNYGAFITFVGIVRDEDNIQGLSFDIYEPILIKWFKKWQQDLNKKGAYLFMAHSYDDVYIHQSSFMCAVSSPKRRIALDMIDAFVEDFKASAPIWKYDIKNNQRIFAKDRAKKLPNSGVLK